VKKIVAIALFLSLVLNVFMVYAYYQIHIDREFFISRTLTLEREKNPDFYIPKHLNYLLGKEFDVDVSSSR
jgi:hypothetical protein